jgi:hypothetical protein
MYIPQIVLMIVGLLAILLWFFGGYQAPQEKDDRLSLLAILLGIWLIASVVLGAYTFVLRFAGIFDITIERMLFAIIILFLALGLFQGKVRFQKNVSVEIAMGVFMLICILSMMRVGFVAAYPEFFSPWFTFITGYLFPFMVFLFAKHYILSEKDVTFILRALFYFGIYLSITAFFEFFDLQQFVFPKYINNPEIGTNWGRARGPFLNAGFNGFGILAGLISGLHLLQKKTGFAKFFHLTSLLLFFPAVFFTNTRMVYIGLLITLFVFLRWYKTSFSKWKLISLPLAVVLIVGIVNAPRLLSPERREGGVMQLTEVDIRIALLKKSYFFFTQQPFTGIGLAQFIPASVFSYRGPVYAVEEEIGQTLQHNLLLGIAAELGIPGFLAYLSLIILISRRLKQLKGKLPEMGIMGNNLRISILAIWCVFLEIGMFMETSNNLFFNAVVFLFAGLADGLYTRSLESGIVAVQSPLRMSQSPMRIMNSHV